MISTQFVLQRDEFLRAQRDVVRVLPRNVRAAKWTEWGALFALILAPLALLPQPEGRASFLPLVTLALVWVVLIAEYAAVRAVGTAQLSAMDGKDVSYEFDDAGFSCATTDGESRLQWSCVAKSIESKELLVLMESTLHFHTIPKRSLTAPDMNRLRELVALKVPA